MPQKLQTDKGTEFFNKHFQQLMKKYNIHHFATASDVKASVIERFNRTLRDRSSWFLMAVNSKRYYDILQDLIDNASYHKRIKMRPLDVHKENEADVFNNLYGRMPKDAPIFRYKIGDVVRVFKVRNVFSKGYEQNYTEEFFTIAACVPRTPPVYRLQPSKHVNVGSTCVSQWATGVQSGHGLKMGILSGVHLGDPARTHMGEPRWAPHVVPRWVFNGKFVHGLKMGYTWDPFCFIKYKHNKCKHN